MGSPPRIGRYLVEAELGRGGFGRVFKAVDPAVSRHVAIKVLDKVEQPESLRRFQREASATAALSHPNVVTVFDAGEHEGSPYIVMEYLEGEDLRRIIQDKRPLSLLAKATIMEQAARGLDFAHSRGVVHRDIKPGNIHVSPDGGVKLMDFGIARLVEAGTRELTVEGAILGTVRYMAPELLRGGTADPLTDIFAFGVVFYELLAEEHPFEARDYGSAIYRITSQDPRPLAEALPGCPPELASIVHRALAKDREQRYPSLGALLRDLEPVLVSLRDHGAESEDVRDSERRSAIDRARAKAAELLAQGAMDEAVSRLEAELVAFPADSQLRAMLEEARRRTVQSASSPAGEMQDRTVIVNPGGSGVAPPPQEGSAEPPRDATGYFGEGLSEPLNAEITILSCPDTFREGQTVRIQTPVFTVGRAADCELAILDDLALSRRHASISWNGSGYVLRDLGTPNGTYLNGRRIVSNTEEPLFLNAEISLSDTTRLRFRCEVSELPDFTGQTLANRYRLEECLRAGRKSAFYRAQDQRPVRKVAVKILSPTLASYPGYLDQFEREAQTAAELNHPNICKIHEYGCEPLSFPERGMRRVHYISMQMLDGGSLAARLDAADATPVWVAGWLERVADALEDAHANGVVHAGIKPTSIVFNSAGVPFVTDFAIAVRPDDGDRRQPVLGAPDYLAPEQWEGQAAGPACDQYSLACLCYRVLTGVTPFRDQRDPRARSRNQQNGPMPAHLQARQQGRGSIPPGISSVLGKALSVRPEDRYPSIAEFARAFRHALSEGTAPERAVRVFVSYRREADAGWAALFADKLSTVHGIDVFIDRQRVDSARHVPEKIEAAIRESDFFVCLLARTTLESAWVREEIRIAEAAGKPMIPVIHEGFRRPAPSSLPAWIERFVLRRRATPEPVKRLLDAEEVRLFADYDQGAIEKLAKMILTRPRGGGEGAK